MGPVQKHWPLYDCAGEENTYGQQSLQQKRLPITRGSCSDVFYFSGKGVITNPGRPGLTSEVYKDGREKVK